MHYLSEMTEEQTLIMCSGHPQGLFPSSPSAPRAVITNGMVIKADYIVITIMIFLVESAATEFTLAKASQHALIC